MHACFWPSVLEPSKGVRVVASRQRAFGPVRPIEHRFIGKLGVGPTRGNLLLVVEEQLPTHLRQRGLLDAVAVHRGPRHAEIIGDAPGAVQHHALARRGSKNEIVLVVDGDVLMVQAFVHDDLVTAAGVFHRRDDGGLWTGGGSGPVVIAVQAVHVHWVVRTQGCGIAPVAAHWRGGVRQRIGPALEAADVGGLGKRNHQHGQQHRSEPLPPHLRSPTRSMPALARTSRRSCWLHPRRHRRGRGLRRRDRPSRPRS